MAGSYQLRESLAQACGIDLRADDNGIHDSIRVGADGRYSVEFVECLASCGAAPVCMVDDRLHENVQPHDAGAILNVQDPVAVRPEPHPLEHRLIFKNIGRHGWDTSIKTYI
jgi:NADH:ubiquinone oxidoreductase subunit E